MKKFLGHLFLRDVREYYDTRRVRIGYLATRCGTDRDLWVVTLLVSSLNNGSKAIV